MKKELLSPVGNFESLKMAVFHGADAVYLGGKKFGARAYAANFSEEELQNAVFFCHLYGVRIYVTVNTMVYESELPEVLTYLGFLNKIHVDAVILADLGLMKLTHEIYPDLVIHASTQVHTHNVHQIEILRDLGVTRVVLARELSLKEIEKFPSDVELEVFVHGALCISYSGQCLFSSMLMHRSGNRGECAQICRLPFTLLQDGYPIETDGKYLLSTRDLNTTFHMKELMDSSIMSFKIEGRMKSPAYVGFMTHLYRRRMDDVLSPISSLDEKRAEVLFSRGFTEGCLFGKKDQAFMNPKSSNHQGIFLGNIVSLDKRKIGIRLSLDLHQGDGIRFLKENLGMMVNFLYHEKGQLISCAKKGQLVFVDNKLGISTKGRIMKTLDSSLEKEILNVSEKKIPITMKANVSLEGFFLEVTDGEFCVFKTVDIVSPAKTQPLTKDSVMKQMCKLGDTPFVIKDISISIKEEVFASVQGMNQLRREVIETLIQKRMYRPEGRVGKEMRCVKSYSNELEIYAMARSEEQLKVLLEENVHGIYVSDIFLYQKYQNKVIFRTNRVQHQVSIPQCKEILAGESGAFSFFQGRKSVDYFFNVANHASVDYWVSKGAIRVCLSPEIGWDEIRHLAMQYPKGNPLEMIIYGRLEVMVLNHCIMRSTLHSKEGCSLCKEHVYSLQDRNGSFYPIVMDEHHRTHLFHHSVFNQLDHISSYYQLGIRKFRLEFFDEDAETVRKILSQVREQINV